MKTAEKLPTLSQVNLFTTYSRICLNCLVTTSCFDIRISTLEMTQQCSSRFVLNDFRSTSSVTSMLNNLHRQLLKPKDVQHAELMMPHKILNNNYNCCLPWPSNQNCITHSWSQFQVYSAGIKNQHLFLCFYLQL